MPSFYVADLGEMSFTLGLSGWTTNNWSEVGNFDLLAPRAEVDALTQRLRADGYRILDGPRRTGDGYYESTVLDPDGNRIEITV